MVAFHSGVPASGSELARGMRQSVTALLQFVASAPVMCGNSPWMPEGELWVVL